MGGIRGGAGPLQTLTVDRVGDTLHVSWRHPDHVEVDTALIRGDTLRFIGGTLRLVKLRWQTPSAATVPCASQYFARSLSAIR